VTTEAGAGAAVAGASEFASDWKELRADDNIQFAPVKMPEVEQQPPPDWLLEFQKWLAEFLEPVARVLSGFFSAIGNLIGVSAQAVMWVAIILAAALVAYLLWRLLSPLTQRQWRKEEAEEAQWVPDAEDAISLLEDADRLAAEGRYDEATHLLLKRSVGQIAEARPDLLEPSSTAREIAALPALSQAARGAFAVIAERVERSLFALRSLSADDWHAARAAYADFALAAPHAEVPA